MKTCVGCGVELQIQDSKKIGFAIKMENDYCLRCFKMKNYGEYNSYEIETQPFFENIKKIVSRKDSKIIFYVIDVLDIKNSRDIKLEALIQNERVIVLVNKIDLMPKSIKQTKILNYVKEAFSDSTIKDLKFTTVSSFNQDSIKHLLGFIKKEKGNKYFIGFSNAGKSSLITALLREANLTSKTVISPFFNTTLNEIKIALDDEISFFDTPGINKKNSLSNLASVDQMKYFYFKKEMKQYTYQLESDQSIVVGGFFSINFDFKNHKTNDIHFYSSSQIDIHRTKTENVVRYWEKNLNLLKPQLIDSTINPYLWKLKNINDKEIDIVISGLGWVSLKNFEKMEFSITILNEKYKNDFEKMIYLRKALI
ncbi:ribosome biogenesis GTPase YqeH [Williamsoniiplasma luminosum]|uniref:Ribosome biogenesis GTPase YqeH n=1 Tax=Williamsoniiplasma luminosum TaxID=214888 RepID=A0A2S0NJE4_9MOLU|nr:ribosome biogenesis GTPase YqeH [Williamsoniiplasma luminosum]AVP49143.1 MAG: ribosome biogenesis GTPase YqeH [Williamsoniiplasma luminosum]